ncbi:uncharacterized protein TRIADDRAFT_58685 [Trichoplax adhaerens]|uniref:Uncharacterized protein n=1 Tax=Trichoplax adhaerens TaxID=10228 RepID=B3S3E1_TRIAD|nr:predicted protein [Trichoplax adhaerens]EDV22775.1 predicted protein [Trichoplax adhaerens]|eukprot:XP_002114641.1 predicted protein [Trichoplax adhaerens]
MTVSSDFLSMFALVDFVKSLSWIDMYLNTPNICNNNFPFFYMPYLTDFICIAYMQGCSFLALPNSIANTGIKPFIGVYFIALVVEIPLTFLVLVIIQKAAVLRKSGRLYAKLKQLNADNSEDDDIDSDAKGSENEKKFNDTEINFHLLSESFLPWFLQIAFDALCFGLLFNAEIANALSGSQVFGHLLRIKFKNILALFVWIEVFLLIFARRLLNLVIPIASLVRCIILLIMLLKGFHILI